MSFAWHDPKSMPKYKPADAEKAEASHEADNARVRGWFIGMALAAEKKKAKG